MAYLTNDDIETLGNIDLTANGEAMADELIPAITEEVEAYTNRKWGVEDPQIEVYDGGRQVYFPKITPVETVESITVDGTELTTDAYFVYDGYIRLDSPASSGRQNVVITYTANVTVPTSIKVAMANWIAQIITNAETPVTQDGKVVKRAQFGPGEVEYFAPQAVTNVMPDFVTTVLDRYRLTPV